MPVKPIYGTRPTISAIDYAVVNNAITTAITTLKTEVTTAVSVVAADISDLATNVNGNITTINNSLTYLNQQVTNITNVAQNGEDLTSLKRFCAALSEAIYLDDEAGGEIVYTSSALVPVPQQPPSPPPSDP